MQIRPFSSREDYESMIDYFLSADDSFLRGMGVDRKRFPEREEWLRKVLLDHRKAEADRERFYLAWIYQGRAVGHSSLSNIRVGEDAYIHLHLWDPKLRKGGLGTVFFKKSIDFCFERFRLKRLFCEPYAENLAPNKVLLKLGFKFIDRYETTPGPMSYEQEVIRYELAAPSRAKREPP